MVRKGAMRTNPVEIDSTFLFFKIRSQDVPGCPKLSHRSKAPAAWPVLGFFLKPKTGIKKYKKVQKSSLPQALYLHPSGARHLCVFASLREPSVFLKAQNRCIKV